VYPVNGINGDLKSDEGTELVLPNTPKMTGTCPLSPSRKNPKTLSPGAILADVALLAAPDPSVTPSKAIAQGRSSSFNSAVLYG